MAGDAENAERTRLIEDATRVRNWKRWGPVRRADLKRVRALREEHNVGRTIVVSREEGARKTDDGIDILHWKAFCARLLL